MHGNEGMHNFIHCFTEVHNVDRKVLLCSSENALPCYVCC